MQILRRLAVIVLWLLALVGLGCGALWAATAAGLIKPLIVVSGSMEPGIMTGDALIDTRVDTASLQPGDVVSLVSPLDGRLVTHRIVEIAPEGAGSFRITLKGDANGFEDALDYIVGAEVWQPSAQLPGWGAAFQRITAPATLLPLGLGLVALTGLSLLIPAPVPRREREAAHGSASATPARELATA